MKTIGPAGPASTIALQQRARLFRTAPARLRARVCQASHILLQSGAPGWAGAASVRDYAQAHLGVPLGTLRTWAEVGDLFERAPAVRSSFTSGQCVFSVATELARARSVLDVESLVPQLPRLRVEDVRVLARQARAVLPGGDARQQQSGEDLGEPRIDPNYDGLTIEAPQAGIGYARDTATLAEAVIGTDIAEEESWDAVAAEASTEVDLTVSAADACRLYRVKLEEAQDPPDENSSAAADSPCTPPVLSVRAGLPAPRFALHGPARLQRADRIFRRLIARLHCLDMILEDELLALYLEDAHRALGYRRFEDFASEQLDLAPRTLWSRIARARRRRMEDPLTIAYTRRQITKVQLSILEELRRHHVPASAHPAWIAAARDITTRQLREMVAWARGQAEQDYRAWALAGFPPPNDTQLQISAPSIEALARSPEPPTVRQLEAAPLVPLRLRLRRETLVALTQMMASLQQQHEKHSGVRPPAWWAFLRICYLARKAWSKQDPQCRPDNHAIHDRDGWRCAIPTCSHRRGLEAHHIIFRSDGGGDEAENLITLCSFHHRPGVHQKTVRVLGRATRGRHSLRFELGLDGRGRPTRVYQGERRVFQDAAQAR